MIYFYTITRMDFVYIKLEHICFFGKSVYYQLPIETQLHRATVFSEHYEYFYDDNVPYSKDSDDSVLPISTSGMRSLGSFRGMGVHSSGYPYYTVDSDIFLFDNDRIHQDNRYQLYCRGIPESPENLEPTDAITYLGYPVFFLRGPA